MPSEPPDHFARAVAARYDAGSPEMFAADVLGPTVDLLAELAGDGPALELAVGTGRVALPLRERGVEVYGIDLSPDMVAQLRAKPGGDAVEVVIGDLASATVGPAGHFTLAYLVFNTIGNLTTQDAQVEAFRNASAHLRTGGAFVIETGVPDLQRLPPGETDTVFHRDADHVNARLSEGLHDVGRHVCQLFASHSPIGIPEHHDRRFLAAQTGQFLRPLIAKLRQGHVRHRIADFHFAQRFVSFRQGDSRNLCGRLLSSWLLCRPRANNHKARESRGTLDHPTDRDTRVPASQ